MPEMSTVAEFVQAVRNHKTSVTIAIQKLWDDRANQADAIAIFNDLDTISFNPVDVRIRNALVQRGLTNAQVGHLNRWPGFHKEEVRRALRGARDRNDTVEFFWELYGGDVSVTKVGPEPNKVNITFQSPRQNVREEGPNTGQIHVDI